MKGIGIPARAVQKLKWEQLWEPWAECEMDATWKGVVHEDFTERRELHQRPNRNKGSKRRGVQARCKGSEPGAYPFCTHSTSK